MSPRPNVTDERTSQIINAAEDVFTKKGFDEARMDDIAEQTGLSKGTLYNYFKSKDDLIIAILDRIFQLGALNHMEYIFHLVFYLSGGFSAITAPLPAKEYE